MHYNVVYYLYLGKNVQTELKIDTFENSIISYRCRLLKRFFLTSITFKAYQNGTTQSKKDYFRDHRPVLVFSIAFTPLCIQCFLSLRKHCEVAKLQSCSVYEWKHSNVNKAVVGLRAIAGLLTLYSDT